MNAHKAGFSLTVRAVLAIGAIGAAIAISTVHTVLAIRAPFAVSALLAIDTILAVARHFTALAVDTRFARVTVATSETLHDALQSKKGKKASLVESVYQAGR